MTLTALGSCMCPCHAASPLVVVQTAKDFFLFSFSKLGVIQSACVRLAGFNGRGQIPDSPGQQLKFKLRRGVKCRVFSHDSRCRHAEVRKILIRSLI